MSNYKSSAKITGYSMLAGLILLIILALTSCTQSAFGQLREKPPPAIYGSFQMSDLGFGIRTDYHFNSWAGIYGSLTYGKWRYYQLSGLDDHVKFTLGAMAPLKDWMGNQHDVTVGLNYHWTSGEITDFENFKEEGIFYQPWSFEIGLTIKYPRFALGFRTDILRWEPCIDIGIPIRPRPKKVKHEMIKPEPMIKRKR